MVVILQHHLACLWFLFLCFGNNYEDFFHALFHILCGHGHKMREHLCFCLFWLQSQTLDLARVCTDSPTSPKVSTDLGYCNLFIQLFSAIAVLATCPSRRVTETSQLLHTNHRSGRNWGSNPGHLRGRQQHQPLSRPLRLASLSWTSIFKGICWHNCDEARKKERVGCWISYQLKEGDNKSNSPVQFGWTDIWQQDPDKAYLHRGINLLFCNLEWRDVRFALSSPFPTKIHILPSRWPGYFAWGHAHTGRQEGKWT
jgi:hypothetical protein